MAEIAAMPLPSSSRHAGGAKFFQTTHWSMILRAGGGSDAALEKLCRAYWQPLYAWVRLRGHSVEEAQDLTQEFFSRILRYGSVANANPGQGRFRSFLLGALKNFLANEWHRTRTLKRGGGQAVFSLDELREAEGTPFEPATEESPDKAFERRWAETLIARVHSRLAAEYEAAGQSARFAALQAHLLGGNAGVSYSETAASIGLSEAAAKSAIYKIRQRFGEMVRHEIAQTVSSPGEIEDEIRHLLAALRG